mmetsp:Transcript_4115/g.9334  ORF Transcript_4115/g.9334 Transcript_4115/m.9334 type:complete len:237 (-) Transcript_4115:792-1502(-)
MQSRQQQRQDENTALVFLLLPVRRSELSIQSPSLMTLVCYSPINVHPTRPYLCLHLSEEHRPHRAMGVQTTFTDRIGSTSASETPPTGRSTSQKHHRQQLPPFLLLLLLLLQSHHHSAALPSPLSLSHWRSHHRQRSSFIYRRRQPIHLFISTPLVCHFIIKDISNSCNPTHLLLTLWPIRMRRIPCPTTHTRRSCQIFSSSSSRQCCYRTPSLLLLLPIQPPYCGSWAASLKPTE